MGPERISPGQERLSDGAVAELTTDWSGEEEEEEDAAINGDGYYYQPLNQEPEAGHGGEEAQTHGEQLQEIQERIQAMGLFLPQPPADSDEDDEDSEAAAARHSQSSIPMDADHVELVKRTMATVKLPSLGIPAWARDISDDQWKDMVQHTLDTRQSAAALRLEHK